MTIVDRIKSLCKLNCTSLSGLGLELGFGKNSIARWNTSPPSMDKVQKVADYFGVAVDYLLGRTDDPTGQLQVIVGKTDDSPLTPDEIAMLKAVLDAYRAKKK